MSPVYTVSSTDHAFIGKLFCSGKFIIGATEVKEGNYFMLLRNPSPRVWHLLLLREGTAPEDAIAMMSLDEKLLNEKPRNRDQLKPDVELEPIENYVVLTIRLTNIELKGKLIIL
jgi:hypothetical protein